MAHKPLTDSEYAKLRNNVLDESNAFPGYAHDMLATIDSLKAELAALTAENVRLTKGGDVQDALNESAYLAGLKEGWNCGVEEARERYQQVVDARAGYLKPIRDKQKAEAALKAAQHTRVPTTLEVVYAMCKASRGRCYCEETHTGICPDLHRMAKAAMAILHAQDTPAQKMTLTYHEKGCNSRRGPQYPCDCSRPKILRL